MGNLRIVKKAIKKRFNERYKKQFKSNLVNFIIFDINFLGNSIYYVIFSDL